MPCEKVTQHLCLPRKKSWPVWSILLPRLAPGLADAFFVAHPPPPYFG
jgi:hypothetical protein